MMTGRRKNYFSQFDFKTKLPILFLVILLFFWGLWISSKLQITGMAVYLLFWFLSYGVIYAGTCKNCIYYGKSCPIPLEGSCVQHFFRPGRAGFGIQSLLWAVIAYVIRFCLPIFIIIRDQMIITGMGYLGILTLFWIIHLGFTGCPNCINDQCPLNFDYKKGSGK